jgi:hypothetical protein
VTFFDQNSQVWKACWWAARSTRLSLKRTPSIFSRKRSSAAAASCFSLISPPAPQRPLPRQQASRFPQHLYHLPMVKRIPGKSVDGYSGRVVSNSLSVTLVFSVNVFPGTFQVFRYWFNGPTGAQPGLFVRSLPPTVHARLPTDSDEFVYVLSGKLILTEVNGKKQEFHPGESVVLPAGYNGTWEMQGNYREIAVVVTKRGSREIICTG